MKIRQALKAYHLSKSRIYKAKSIHDKASFINCEGFRRRQIYTSECKAATKRFIQYLQRHNKCRKIMTYSTWKGDVEYYLKDIPNFPNNLPKIGEKTYSYDDGKIRLSREFKVTIKSIIPFNEASEELLKMWKEEVNECYWLYSSETDYFIEAINVEDESVWYCRTMNGDWFSFNGDLLLGSGLLDTNNLHINIIKDWVKYIQTYNEEVKTSKGNVENLRIEGDHLLGSVNGVEIVWNMDRKTDNPEYNLC